MPLVAVCGLPAVRTGRRADRRGPKTPGAGPAGSSRLDEQQLAALDVALDAGPLAAGWEGQRWTLLFNRSFPKVARHPKLTRNAFVLRVGADLLCCYLHVGLRSGQSPAAWDGSRPLEERW